MGILVLLQYACFFVLLWEDVMFFFIIAVEFDHSGSYIGISGSDIRSFSIDFKNLCTKLDYSSAFRPIHKNVWAVQKFF